MQRLEEGGIMALALGTEVVLADRAWALELPELVWKEDHVSEPEP